MPQNVRGTSSGPKLIHVADWCTFPSLHNPLSYQPMHRYPTFCGLAGVDAADPALLDGAERPIDGVDVWDLLTQQHETPIHPRNVTPTTEVSVIDVSNASRWWKLITLAGQSNHYYKNQTSVPSGEKDCLSGRQPDPPQPGRTDSLVTGCPVCNSTFPCLYDLLADPAEEHNLAAFHPDVVERLAPVVKKFEKYYVPGHLTKQELEDKYEPVDPTKWGGFVGPCYTRKQHTIKI